VALINADTEVATVEANWKDVGIPEGTTVDVYDAIAGKSLGPSSGPIRQSVQSHDVAVFVLTPVQG